MSIVSVNKLFTGRGGTDNFRRRKTWRETWEVVVSSLTDDDESTAAQATGVPRIGQRHEKYPAGVVVDVSSDQSEDSPYIWYISVQYDTQPDMPDATDPTQAGDGGGGSTDPKDIPENPLARPARWRTFFESVQEVAQEGYAVTGGGKDVAKAPEAILNSAGCQFDPPVMVEVDRFAFAITKNVKSISVAALCALQGAVNEKPWRGAPARTMKVKSVETQSGFENGVSFVEATLTIVHNPDTWDVQILDCGYYEKKTRTDPTDPTHQRKLTKLERMRDPTGAECTEPLPLNGHGLILRPDLGDKPVFLRWVPKQQRVVDFATALPF